MAKALSILFVSSEVYPFAKVGGVGDVSYSLPLALRDLGHDVRVMLPKYGTISERKNRIHEINRLKDMPIPMGKGTELATVKSSSINNPRTKVQAYITTNDKYFDSKKGIYNDPKTWKEYKDNAERFIFFNRTVVETCVLLGWYPDIIHCNDWQTAIIPAYAKALYEKEFRKTKIVFTIHNFFHQGEFSNVKFNMTGLPKETKAKFNHKQKFNFMKGAIHYSDYITTVSPAYAEEILTDRKYSNGLSSFLKKRMDDFKGILNGIDIWGWNPRKDSLIASKFKSDIENYKYDNKVELCNMTGLEFKPRIPIVGMITRFDKQKGIESVIRDMDKLMNLDIQMVILGEGETAFKKQLKNAAAKYPENLKVIFEIDDKLAHQIEAGSDIFLIPSFFEPCGLNLMYSLSYGTVPVYSDTGGMKNIGEGFDPETKKGNSFVFNNANAGSLLKAVKSAVDAFQDEDIWQKIIKDGMNSDFSWDKSAKEYDEIYRQLLKS